MSPARTLHEAFALTIASEIPLLELPASTGTPDVEVFLGRVDAERPSEGNWSIVAAPDDVRGWIPDGGGFRVRGGREIVIDPAPDADDRALRLGIVGPLLGVILTQRGKFVLHASSVVIDGRAVAFTGPSGRGKSTLATALARAGHPLVADDITVIDTTGDEPVVLPGFPRVKLWPDSAGVFAENADALPLLHPARTKRSLQLDDFHGQPVRLARCYLLEDGGREAVTEIAPREAVLALIGCTYQAQWLHQTGASGGNLLHCGALARSGVVRRLQRRRDFEALADVVRFVEDDVRASVPL
jgi:energy-coupling factor transporter ATP-binding protein EcfA2